MVARGSKDPNSVTSYIVKVWYQLFPLYFLTIGVFLRFVDIVSTGASCVPPSIIRAYFVAVFQTARRIINVAARTATYNQLYFTC